MSIDGNEKKHEAEKLAIKTLQEVIGIPCSTIHAAAVNERMPNGNIVQEKTIDGFNVVAECFKDSNDPESRDVKVTVSLSGYSVVSNFLPTTKSAIVTCV